MNLYTLFLIHTISQNYVKKVYKTKTYLGSFTYSVYNYIKIVIPLIFSIQNQIYDVFTY